MDSSVPKERGVALLAARQYGHVTRHQLSELGFSSNEISKRLTKGRLIPVFRGVFAVGHPRPEAIAQAAAAVLACGPHAILGYRSAAALWEMGIKWPALPEVIVPAKRRPSGIRVHVHPTLPSRDIRTHKAIRTTSPARTLYDLAPTLTGPQLARAINEARLSKRLRIEDLRRPRLEHFTEYDTGPTRSQFEDRFRAFAQEHGLPTPTMNARVHGYEVDALFPSHKVIVELDGFKFHGDRQSFERDRERDATLLAAGYVTIRITWQRLTQHPGKEAARLQAILQGRPGHRLS